MATNTFFRACVPVFTRKEGLSSEDSWGKITDDLEHFPPYILENGDDCSQLRVRGYAFVIHRPIGIAQRTGLCF